MRGSSAARDIARLYRVRDWIHFLPLPLAGWFSSADGTLVSLIGGVFGWALGLAYTCCINQAFDDRLDSANIGKNPVGENFGRREAIILSIPPAVGSLVVVALTSPSGLVAAVTLLIVATLYSAPPRLKRIPGLGTIWNLVIGVPGLFYAGQPDFSAGALRLLGGLFAWLLLISQLIHEAKDRDDDRAGGIATVATLTGVRGALGAAVFFLALLPPVTWLLSNGVSLRIPLTVASTVFSIGWIVALVARIARRDETGLRQVRLQYRYACLVLGGLAFAATVL
jgi:4-hydroxybenzoate polyprenyltransferase